LKKLGASAGAESGKNGVTGTGIGKGGTAAPGWAEKISKKILPLITFNNSTISGNPAAIVRVRLAPDGAILNREIITSSGVIGFDQAVLFALDKAQTLPKDDSGHIPDLNPTLTFRPQDK
jgi:colicin import membrane protein